MNINNEIELIHENDSNDEDNVEYYLQATPGPYNIQEKIRAANDELFEDYEEYNNIPRSQRVTFRDELVDYEPDYSSDDGYVHSPDILSVISDNENEETQEDDIIEEQEIEEEIEESMYSTRNLFKAHNSLEKFESVNDSKIIDLFTNKIECDISDEEEIEEECNEEIIEEIFDDEIVENENLQDEDDLELEEPFIEVIEIIQDSPEECISTKPPKNKDTKPKTNIKPKKKHSPTIPQIKINCRLHCLEKHQLDILTGMSSPPKSPNSLQGPILKLRKRTCCTSQEYKPKLPIYNGFLSEYGLTKSQLEKRQNRKERNAQRRKEKLARIQEEKRQKDQYNEEIFCAWLKTIENRNKINNNKDSKLKITEPYSNGKQRPKTANSFLFSPLAKKEGGRKRPNTSPSKGYSYKINFQ